MVAEELATSVCIIEHDKGMGHKCSSCQEEHNYYICLVAHDEISCIFCQEKVYTKRGMEFKATRDLMEVDLRLIYQLSRDLLRTEKGVTKKIPKADYERTVTLMDRLLERFTYYRRSKLQLNKTTQLNICELIYGDITRQFKEEQVDFLFNNYHAYKRKLKLEGRLLSKYI